MGGRYLISGAQLGALITLCRTSPDACNEKLNEICEEQFVSNSTNDLATDIEFVKSQLEE